MEDEKTCPVHKQGVQSFHKRGTGNWVNHGYGLGYEDGEKQEKDWLLRFSLMSPDCLSRSTAFWPQLCPRKLAVQRHRMATAGSKRHPTAPARCPCTFHCHSCTSMLFPCMWEDTVATYSLHSLRRWSHKQPLTCNTYRSNLPLGFQFSAWICSPLSLHQREAGSSF